MHHTYSAPRILHSVLLIALGLTVQATAEAQLTPIEVLEPGHHWDTQVFQQGDGYVQVLTAGGRAQLDRFHFQNGHGPMIPQRIIQTPTGLSFRPMPEGTAVPAGVQEGRVGDMLYTRRAVRSTWLVRRDRMGSPLSTTRVVYGDRDIDMAGRPLPDGDLLLYGRFFRWDHSVGLVMRVGLDGTQRWAVETTHQSVPQCDPTRRMCRFSDVHDALVMGDLVVLSGAFHTGTLLVDGREFPGARQLNGFHMALDLRDGQLRWLRNANGETSPSRMNGELVSIRQHRGRAHLQHLDPNSGRVRETHPLHIAGPPQRVVSFGNGIAVLSGQGSRHLQGFDGNGHLVFSHSGLDVHTQLVATGDHAFAISPRTNTYPDIEQLEVHRFSLDGTHQQIVHRGVWRQTETMLQPLANGHAMLSVVAHGNRARMVFRDAFTPFEDPSHREQLVMPPPQRTSPTPSDPFAAGF